MPGVTFGVSPPRPRLTVRVGLCGHRWNKLRVEHSKDLIARLDQTFALIEQIAAKVAAEPRAGYRAPEGPAPQPELRLLTGLAEGADRLGAHSALCRPVPWTIQAILPYDETAYRQDFRPPGTRQPPELGDSEAEFTTLLEAARRTGGVHVTDGVPGREDRYVPLAVTLALNADVLVAVWNGLPESGPGGTAHIVERAHENGIPVIRLLPDASQAPVLWTPRKGAEPLQEPLEQVEERIRRLLESQPASRDRPGHPRPRPSLREAYFAEKLRIHQRTEAELRNEWRSRWTAARVGDSLIQALLATGVPDHYAWADTLATEYGQRHRRGYRWIYWLAVGAVGATAAGLVHLFGEERGRIVPGVEVLALLVIVGILARQHWHKVHDRWLDYRALAELLRYLPVALALGRSPVLRVRPGAGAGTDDSWVDWFFRAAVREAGLLPVSLREELASTRALIAEAEIPHQIAYHEKTYHRNERSDRVYHNATIVAFSLGFLLAVSHLLEAIGVYRLPETPHPWLGVAALVLPALGAALHGIRAQSEFEDTALRSYRTARQLEDARKRLLEVEPLTVDTIGAPATDAVAIMSGELREWFTAYLTKPPVVP
ncbi:MAG: hypothetical protein ACRENB_09845 [Gemmatimonadales bacterium]